MASLKISQMSSGNPAQSNDLLVIDRGGSNFSVTAASIAALGLSFVSFLKSHGWVFGGDQSGSISLSKFGCQVGASGFVGASGQVSAIEATATNPPLLQYKSSLPSSGSIAGAVDNATSNAGTDIATGITLGTLSQGCYRVMLSPSFPVQRAWIGMGEATCISSSGVAMKSDAPAKNVVAFRYSPAGASDTTWKAICQTDATHQTIVDTLIIPDTNLHTFQILSVGGGTSIQFWIDGVLVATVSSNIPVNSLRLANLVFQDNQTNTSAATAILVSSMGWLDN
jgi:hypothetical protein